jgi:hypothetical protein
LEFWPSELLVRPCGSRPFVPAQRGRPRHGVLWRGRDGGFPAPSPGRRSMVIRQRVQPESQGHRWSPGGLCCVSEGGVEYADCALPPLGAGVVPLPWVDVARHIHRIQVHHRCSPQQQSDLKLRGLFSCTHCG